MAGEHPRRLDPLEPGERRERLPAVVGEGRRLRATGPSEHVPRGEGVADEERSGVGHVHGDAARGVAGKADDARGAGQVEHVLALLPDLVARVRAAGDV